MGMGRVARLMAWVVVMKNDDWRVATTGKRIVIHVSKGHCEKGAGGGLSWSNCCENGYILKGILSQLLKSVVNELFC